MQVSFIIPLFNCLSHTRECVRTLRASLPAALPHEIILVDDGSTDGTREWLATLPARPFKVVLNERNLGYAAANNRGATAAQGTFLALLNNDLVLAPGWLEPMMATHDRLSSPGLVGNIQRDARTGLIDHTGIFFDHKGKPAHDTSLPFPALLYPGYRIVSAVTGACALLSATLWRTLGGFDEGYVNGSEDVDLCLRARDSGRINAVSLRSTVLHHISASPGRKLRDEENSRRLAVRWRHTIPDLAAPAWADHFLNTRLDEPFTSSNRALAFGSLACLVGRKTPPPPLVRQATHHALDAEIARWDRLFAPR